MKRYLVLEDGTVYKGEAFGADCQTTGEVVFTTGMTGYQEAVTDQSFANQILVFTNPLIGNYGVNLDDYESLQPNCRGVVCREVARVSDSWRKQDTFDNFLKQMNIPGIKGIDTRALTKKLRVHGTMKGSLIDPVDDLKHAFDQLHATVISDQVVAQVSTKRPYPNPGSKRNIVLVDFGAKHSILRELAKRDCNTIVVPYNTTAEQILALKPDGVMLSNGPGDPETCVSIIEEIKKLYNTDIPIFAICLGHQLMALANGAKTYKLKYGHRGGNHPVKDLTNNRVYISSQNHGYAVDGTSIDPKVAKEAFINVNDGTNEGLAYEGKNIFTVQFHPEACPGPLDSGYLFDRFMDMMKGAK